MSALTDLYAKYRTYGQAAQKAAYTGKAPAYNVPSTTAAYSAAYGGATAPAPKAVSPVTKIINAITSWITPPTGAQLAPGVAEKAMDYFLAHPLSPVTQAWSSTLPSDSANDTIRRELQIRALNQQLVGYKAETAGLKSLYPTPGVNAQGQPTAYITSPFGNMNDVYSWLSGKFPDMYSQQGEIPFGKLAGTPEYWQAAKGISGQSKAGQSLLGSLQDWMGNTPFTPGAVQGQGPTGQVPGKGFTPEEWGRMGRPLGGAYPGWGGVPPSGPELAKTAISPEGKYWWEGGTMMGAPTPEQLNTPEYVKGYFNTLFDPGTHPELYDGNKLNTVGEAASENFWDAFTSDAVEGFYTPEQISKDPEIHEAVVTEMLMRDKYDQKWVETLQDKSLGKVITQVASQDPTKLPPTISQERLDAMVRGPDFATLYDTGYRSQAYQDEVTTGIQQAQSTGAQITYDPVSLNSLTYANIEGLRAELAQISPAQWQTIVEGNGQITLKTEFWKFNEKGETINKGSWDIDYPPQSEMKQSEKERYIDQQEFYNEWYWSDEATAQRQKEREESYEYYQEKDLEGWKEYYAALDAMKLYPDASEYWSQAGKFAELRRKWETSGAGLSWDAWLQQFDFEGEWYALPPQERVEKPYIYSPRMIRLNY
jgi:hypothetical protein